jgi:nucleotide-binding universal stress UspA family protein
LAQISEEVVEVSKILVCYEERPVAQRVLERTAMLARALGAEVCVTSVAPILHGRGGPIDVVDPPARHEAEVAEAAARLAELGIEDVEMVPLLGDPADAIARLADQKKVDLIVLGAHDGGMLSRLITGNVGDAVVHRATTDVLIVH